MREKIDEETGTCACPKCGAALSAKAVAKMRERTILTMRINTEPGMKLQLATWGSVMVNLDKMLKASAKELGGRTVPMLDAVRPIPDGLEIDILLAEAK